MGDRFDDWLTEREPVCEPRTEELLPGTVVGTCTVCALLGRGGFADVYRAQDADGTFVALKVLHRLDEKTRLRFERESRILAQVRHPNFPRLLGFGSCGARPYVVTELLGAYELPNRDRAVARFLQKVISAVAELHRSGFVHRDIKPANILRRADGEPVVIDFGLVAPLSSGQREREALSVDGSNKLAVGTVGYSAPEQFSGQAAGREADVHAIGALIRDCFPGRMPSCWRRIYLQATNSNPKVRYHTVQELGVAIRRRHVRKILVFLLSVIVLGLAAYLSMDLARSYRIENAVPRKFQEKAL